MSVGEMFTQEFWDNRYGGSERVWSGNPNPQLLAYGSGLTPGAALDVGCGEGADAIWLAARGWKVTGVDISPVGLERAAAHAAAASETIAARIDWRHVDLFADEFEPSGAFDLVSSHYLHLPPAVRERSVGRLASAVPPAAPCWWFSIIRWTWRSPACDRTCPSCSARPRNSPSCSTAPVGRSWPQIRRGARCATGMASWSQRTTPCSTPGGATDPRPIGPQAGRGTRTTGDSHRQTRHLCRRSTPTYSRPSTRRLDKHAGGDRHAGPMRQEPSPRSRKMIVAIVSPVRPRPPLFASVGAC